MDEKQLALACEQALAESVADVATELRLVNVIDLIDFVQGERNANLEDIINSSAELYFRHGALRYAWGAMIDVHWNAPPSVSLNMEFSWRGAFVLFRLVLDKAQASVEIQHMDVEPPCADPQDRLFHLAESLASARLTPPSRPLHMLKGAGF
jgi:hypothetical protein